jgi:putative Holliday junction resolvase
MGLDLGTETIGIAVSDDTRLIASGQMTLQRRKLGADLESIAAMIEGQPICGFVLGYPMNMDGTLGPRAQATRQFARDLFEAFDVPVLLWDERLSTAAVQRMMIDEADMSRKRRAEVVDKLAASYMLQGALDAIAMHKENH